MNTFVYLMREHEVSQRRRLYALYRCSHCGAVNLQPVSMPVDSVYSGMRRNSSAEAIRLNERLAELRLETLRSGEGAAILHQCGLWCCCAHCGGVEPWAKMRLRGLRTAVYIGTLATVLLLAVTRLRSPFGWIIGGVTAALAALRWGLLWRRRTQTKRIMQTCPPLFDDDLDALGHRAAASEHYAQADWQTLRREREG